MNSPHKRSVTWSMFPFDDVIIVYRIVSWKLILFVMLYVSCTHQLNHCVIILDYLLINHASSIINQLPWIIACVRIYSTPKPIMTGALLCVIYLAEVVPLMV